MLQSPLRKFSWFLGQNRGFRSWKCRFSLWFQNGLPGYFHKLLPLCFFHLPSYNIKLNVWKEVEWLLWRLCSISVNLELGVWTATLHISLCSLSWAPTQVLAMKWKTEHSFEWKTNLKTVPLKGDLTDEIRCPDMGEMMTKKEAHEDLHIFPSWVYSRICHALCSLHFHMQPKNTDYSQLSGSALSSSPAKANSWSFSKQLKMILSGSLLCNVTVASKFSNLHSSNRI